MRLCDIIDIKSAFMEKTDLSEEEIQTIIDDIPTAFDGNEIIDKVDALNNAIKMINKTKYTKYINKSEDMAKQADWRDLWQNTK